MTRAVQQPPRQLDLFGRGLKAPLPREAPRTTEQLVREVVPPPAPAPTWPTPLVGIPLLQFSGERPPSRQETLARARVLAARLADELGPSLKVLLTVHDNRSTMISFRRQPPLLKVRAHHMFLDAPPSVVKAIADYAGRGRQAAGAEIDDYIAAQQARIRAVPTRSAVLESRGQCFDLQELLEKVNAEHFERKIEARIGWGRQTSKRRRKSIRLGVYDHKAREIRIHPALDKPDVPRFFVEFIVYHEMLHQLFPSARDSGRHVHHPRAFRERERAFPKYDAAMAWERQHLQELLRR
jgi:hypothetical protein